LSFYYKSDISLDFSPIPTFLSIWHVPHLRNLWFIVWYYTWEIVMKAKKNFIAVGISVHVQSTYQYVCNGPESIWIFWTFCGCDSWNIYRLTATRQYRSFRHYGIPFMQTWTMTVSSVSHFLCNFITYINTHTQTHTAVLLFCNH
jgi:hypothetical protein